MGQAKERKARLGKWYGKPIGPGHPDFIPPKKPEPLRPLLRFDMFDETGKVFGAKIDRFDVYGDRIEVEFVDGKRDSFWPVLSEAEGRRGKLTIGSREFGDVELDRYTSTGCIFLRSQPAQEEPMHPEATRTLSGIDEAREDGLHAPQTASRRFPGMLPKNRRLPGMAALALFGMVLASGIDLGPAPSPRPKKR